MDGKFSFFFPPITNTSPNMTLSLEEVWRFIKGEDILVVKKKGSPIGTLEQVTNIVRAVRDFSPEKYNSKTEGKVSFLPLVTFGGTFSRRGVDGLEETSGLVNLDIDHISSLGLSLEDLKERLSKDREIGVRLLFTSPSGDGLKIVCKTSGQITDGESYRGEFERLQYFVSQKYSIPIGEEGLDKGISDISRGCLLCHDPHSVLCVDGGIFDSESHPLPEREERDTAYRNEVDSSDFDFIEGRLIPAMFERVDEIFPEMQFRWNRNKWESPFKLDGSP